MLDVYELGTEPVTGCDDDPAAYPSITRHILIASILQLSTAAGDSCMLPIFIPGRCALLLEHDAVVATIRANAPASASLDMQRIAAIMDSRRIHAAVEATAATSLCARSSSSSLRPRSISSLPAM